MYDGINIILPKSIPLRSPRPMPGKRKDMDMAGAIIPIMAPASAPPAAMSMPAAMSPPASAMSPMSWSTFPRDPTRLRSRPGIRGEQSTGVRRRRGAVSENIWEREMRLE